MTHQYNVKIEDEADDFEGLDFVLLRSVTETGEEENIADSYNNALSEGSLTQNLLQDALRRETYLNALYGEMKIDDDVEDKLDTVIVCSDFYKGQDGLEEKYRTAFQNWQHIPTYDINTFTGNIYRLNRIVKLYLKKHFDPEPTIKLLLEPENLSKIHTVIGTCNRNIFTDANNSYKKVIFELLIKKAKILTDNGGNNIVMNKLLYILYYVPYLFGLDANKIPQDKILFEERCRQIILRYIDEYNNAKTKEGKSTIIAMKTLFKKHIDDTPVEARYVEYINNGFDQDKRKVIQCFTKMNRSQVNNSQGADLKREITEEEAKNSNSKKTTYIEKLKRQAADFDKRSKTHQKHCKDYNKRVESLKHFEALKKNMIMIKQ